jgi:S1-C subfamily serine protease
VSTVTPELARALNLDRPAGAIVNDIWPGGPADGAGVQPGDVVMEAEGQPVHDAETLHYRIGVKDATDSVDIAYLRDGRRRTAQLRLTLPPEDPARDLRRLEGDHPLNGVRVANLSPRYNEELGLDPLSSGVIVTDMEPGSFAARRGLRAGHKILSVNGRKTSTAAELAQEIAKPASRWVIEVDAGGRVVQWRVER